MLRQQLILTLFILSLVGNASFAVADGRWLAMPAILVGWYLADFVSGLVHMYMDYRPCTPGKGLYDIFAFSGSRESEEYKSLLRSRMSTIGPLERLSYDFKNHHPRPDALGRRGLWQQIGSSVILGALPLSAGANVADWLGFVPGWVMAGLTAFCIGSGFAQYFHGSLHRQHNPWFIRLMRQTGLLMTREAHQIHHDTLRRDFATNNGWSNPAINALFKWLRARGLFDDAGLTPAP